MILFLNYLYVLTEKPFILFFWLSFVVAQMTTASLAVAVNTHGIVMVNDKLNDIGVWVTHVVTNLIQTFQPIRIQNCQ